MKSRLVIRPHHVVRYNGREVTIDYVGEAKREFSVACMRVHDNIPAGGCGHVFTPDGRTYKITRENRAAILCLTGEADYPAQPAARMAVVDSGETLTEFSDRIAAETAGTP